LLIVEDDEFGDDEDDAELGVDDDAEFGELRSALVVLLLEADDDEEPRSAEYDPGALFSALACAQSALTIVPL